MIKYGVVDMATIKKDLYEWNALYLAGRLHKPVKHVQCSDDIVHAENENIQSAMRAAMLLCPQTFNISELLSIICSLSYIGDIRLGFAEDSKKVQRIVKGSHAHLCNLYNDAIHTALNKNMLALIGPSQSVVNSRSVFKNTLSLEDKATLYGALPRHVLHKMASQKRGDALPRSVQQQENGIGEYLASSRYGTLALQRALASIVRRSSFRQACLGALSAGPIRSVKYVSAKMMKFLNT
jgi:mitochondrial translocator assembly and maintenance protein 41